MTLMASEAERTLALPDCMISKIRARPACAATIKGRKPHSKLDWFLPSRCLQIGFCLCVDDLCPRKLASVAQAAPDLISSVYFINFINKRCVPVTKITVWDAVL